MKALPFIVGLVALLAIAVTHQGQAPPADQIERWSVSFYIGERQVFAPDSRLPEGPCGPAFVTYHGRPGDSLDATMVLGATLVGQRQPWRITWPQYRDCAP